MSQLVERIQQMPAPAQIGANGTAIGTAIASFLEMIHGPASTIVLLLSGVWLGLQIYGWIEKRRKR